MKSNQLIKKLCGLVGLYLMFCLIFGTGMFLTVAANNVDVTGEGEVETTNLLDIEEVFPNVHNSEPYTTNFDLCDPTSEEYKKIEEAVKPVYKEQVVKLQANVEGLNIRKDKSTESDIIGVMYQGEIAITEVPYVLERLQLEEWVKVGSGYVKTEYIEFIEEEIDLIEYRLTSKGTYTKNPVLSFDVTERSYVSAEDLSQVTEGTALEGLEHAVVAVEENYGINGLFVYAVATLESGGGTSQIARDKNNLFGMNAQDHDPYNLAFSYDSFYESAADFAERINKYYVDAGLTNVSTINEKYSSDDAWDSKVSSIMQRTYKSIIE